MCADNVNYQQAANTLELPVLYTVPLHNATIPTAS